MPKASVTFKTIADAVKYFGGEANTIKVLERGAAQKTREKSDRALLAQAKEMLRAGTLKVPTAAPTV